MTERRKLTTFYSLLLTQALSLMGSKMTSIALGIYIYQTTGDATPLTLVAFFSWLPRLVSMGVAGVLADRYDRRYVMALADAAQALGTVALLVSLAGGSLQLGFLYAVTLFQALFDVFQGPAFQATVTMLIPDKQRDRANAVQLVTSPLAGIFAPALTAVFYAAVGVAGIIVFDLVTFVVSIVVILALDIPKPERSAEATAARGSMWREAMAGFAFVWARKPLLMVFVFTASTNFFLAAMITLQTPYILARTGSEATLGALLSVFSAGSLAGTLLMAVWGGTRPRIHTMMPGIAITGLALVFMGTRSEAPLMALALFIMALAPPMNNVSIISILQLKVPPDLQGRVFAAISQISMILIPLSYLVSGPLVDNVFEPLMSSPDGARFSGLVGSGAGAGMGLLMVISGAAITLVSLGIYALPMVRRLETTLPDYAPTPAPEESPAPAGSAAAEA